MGRSKNKWGKGTERVLGRIICLPSSWSQFMFTALCSRILSNIHTEDIITLRHSLFKKYVFERQRDTESSHQPCSPDACSGSAGLSGSQQPGTQCRSPEWVAGTWSLQSSLLPPRVCTCRKLGPEQVSNPGTLIQNVNVLTRVPPQAIHFKVEKT